MSISIVYKFDGDAEAVLQQHAGRATRLLGAVDDALRQGVQETAAHLLDKYLSGGNPAIKRDGKSPLAVRSGALRQSIDGRLTGRWRAEVGAVRRVAPYAKVLLGGKTWTMTPTRSKWLWIPVADNRAKQGGAKISPRQALEQRGPRGGRLLSIFTSRSGNTVAFLREPGGVYKRGKNKGRQRGRLLFVLKKSVEVKGTDALAMAVEDKRPRVTALVQQAVTDTLGGN